MRFSTRTLPYVLLCTLLVLPIWQHSSASSAPRDRFATRQAALAALRAATGGALDAAGAATTGSATFIAAHGDARLPATPALPGVAGTTGTALGFLDTYRVLFDVDDVRTQLAAPRSAPDTQLGWMHLRFDQLHRGVPVFGRQLVVHLDGGNRVVAVNGRFAGAITIDTEPTLTAADAEILAVDYIIATQLDMLEQARVTHEVLTDHTQLMVYIDAGGKPRLTWQVSVFTESPLGVWKTFVNAGRPRVEHTYNNAADAKRRITYTARNTTRLPGRRVIDEGERANDKVAQAAHDGAGEVYDYFFNNFKRDGIDGRGSPIVSTVNYGRSQEDAENAAWIGELQQMIYGDGGRIFRPLSLGLDVVAHELTHGITDNTAQLIYENQSGALNESYSDVFGALIDDANWTMGEQVVKSPPFPTRVLRSLEDPNLGVYDPREPLNGVGQPATVDEYARLPNSRDADNGGVHINSGIPNHAAYWLAQAIGREQTGQIYYRALTQYLQPSSDFGEAAAATVRAAQDLYGAEGATAARAAFGRVGITAGDDVDLPPPTEDPSDIPDIPPQPDTQEPLPEGCTNVVVNGGFESNEAWVEVTARDLKIIDTELPYAGKRSAWLGGTDQESVQIVYQEVRLPPNAGTIKLSYQRLIHEEFVGLGNILGSPASFSTVLATTNGDIVANIEQLSSEQGDDQWNAAEFDLTSAAGKTLRLAFAAENPKGNISSMFVDDVVLEVCTFASGGSPSTPAPAASDQVFIEGVVSDANSGRGIAGAQVFIMKPGVSATQAARDDNITESEVIAFATSDNSGYYRSEVSIPRGQTYSVIVVANRYRPIIANDGLELPVDAENPFRADAAMRR